MTYSHKNDIVQGMKFPSLVLLSIFLVSCDDHSQQSTAALAESASALEKANKAWQTMRADELAARAEKATGVEKLLRTSSHAYDTYHNSEAWSDEEFFRHYAEALSQDMESFVKNTLYDGYVVEQLGQARVAQEAETSRQSSTQLAEAAKAAYTAAMAWFEADVKDITPEKLRTEFVNNFRLLLRQRLLKDLFILGKRSAYEWCTGITEDATLGSAVKLVLPDFESGVKKRGWMGNTYSETKTYEMIAARLESQIQSGRDFIYGTMYETEEASATNNGPGKADIIKLLEASEAAWNTYRDAITKAHTPVYNNIISGSATNTTNLRFGIDMQLSHLQYLGNIVSSAHNGQPVYPKPIDFTQYEALHKQNGSEQQHLD